jgi:hypothetical protein
MERAIFTVFQDDVEVLGRLDEALVFYNVGMIEVLKQVDFELQPYSQYPILVRITPALTIITLSSLFGKSAKRTCLIATVCPVPQFNARYTLPKAPFPKQSPNWYPFKPSTSAAALCAVPSLLGPLSASLSLPGVFEPPPLCCCRPLTNLSDPDPCDPLAACETILGTGRADLSTSSYLGITTQSIEGVCRRGG